MAESTVTQTGVDEMNALWRAMPERVDTISARVARGTANAMVVKARSYLQSPTPATKGPHQHSPGESMAQAIEIVEDLPSHAIRVVSNAPSQYPANLTIWREFGTSHQPARPYMRPAAEAVRSRYEQDLVGAMEQLAREVSS